MAEFLLLLMPIAAVAAGTTWFLRHHRWHLRLERFADRHQLTYQPGGPRRTPSVRGTADIITHVETTRTHSPGWVQTIIRLSGVPPGLTVHARSGFSKVGFESNDSDFDREIAVWGEAATLRALLDMETRAVLRAAVAELIEVADGQVTWRCAGHPSDVRLEAAYAHAQAVVRRLQRPSDANALAQVAIADLPEVACAAFQHLPAGATREAAIDTILADRRDAMTLLAADARGPSAQPVVAEIAGDPDRPEALRRHALVRLAPPLSVEIALACLDETRSAATLVEKALDVLRAADVAPTPSVLARLITEPVEIATRAARLVQPQTQDGEALLIAALGHTHGAVARAAADRLAEIGTATAVMPLRAAARRARSNTPTGDAIRAAIEQIQARVGDAERGGLAVLAADGGGLALDEPGEPDER